jgi:hypothetical protein
VPLPVCAHPLDGPITIKATPTINPNKIFDALRSPLNTFAMISPPIVAWRFAATFN